MQLLPILLGFAAGVTAAPLSASASITAVPLSALPSPNPATFHPDLAPSVDLSVVVPPRACGVAPPSDFILHAHANAHAASNATQHATRDLATRSPLHPTYTIETYFHIVSTADQASLVTKSMVANQFGALQAAYAPANLAFALAGVDFSVNDTWATDAADADMKTALRRGNYSALNVYFQTNLSSPAPAGSGSAAGAQLLGYCTLPTNVTYSPCDGCAPVEFPGAAYALDGCNVLAASMPAGPLAGYDLGKTAVHEVGHWFGLLHTFQDATCAAGDAGDLIADTPQQSTATSGCPVGKDSCPDRPGVDAVHNFMDYSTDRW